ncbi:hypothetical protein Prum_055470 [Phytohabitans rumicis]|uniref:Uncharacterized protein n=1 Tax=Phytohabitans rumicis TaxID=1076125 RepID=A0A6V8LH06_9ACTN|nr:hypothetical protein Prum_055470 [Phytohabitans rumicis]
MPLSVHALPESALTGESSLVSVLSRERSQNVTNADSYARESAPTLDYAPPAGPAASIKDLCVDQGRTAVL